MANDAVAVRNARNRSASIVYRVTRGTKVSALTGIVITVKAGRVHFRQPIDLQVVGALESLHVEPEETLYLLTYRGEGFTKAWFNGRVYNDVDGSEFFNASCQVERPTRCNGEIIEHPQRVWWVQMKNAEGELGWTDEPEKFDGKGAFE